MAPAPDLWHQDFEGDLEGWFRDFWRRSTSGLVFHNVNVSDRENWKHNFRVPDLVLVLPHQREILCDTHILGAPAVVVEIRSPGDESYEKLPFYAALGVPEVWIIDRDSKVPEVYVLTGDQYEQAAPSEGGWLASKAAGVEFKSTANAKFGIRLAGKEASYRELPSREGPPETRRL